MKVILQALPCAQFAQQNYFKSLKTQKAFLMALLLSMVGFLFSGNIFSQTTQNFTSNGNFTVPAGVYSITVEAWGAGGAGGGNTTGNDGGGGGGGGAYSKSTISVTPGTVYTVRVGTGGSGSTGNGGAGGDSWFNNTSTVLAKGGNGGSAVSGGNGGAFGTGGAAASGTGTTKYSGGNGGIGRNNSSGQGGPGGSSAGTSSNGRSEGSSWSTRTAGSAPNGGGDGGDGGASGGNGSNGAIPGGAGGGAGDETFFNSNKTGGAGARGQVAISYTQPTYKSQLVSMDLGSSTWCRGETRDVTIKIKNIGTATWTDGTGGTPEINIGVKWNQSGSNWTDYYIRTGAENLAPGQTGTYVLSLTASNNTGSGYTTSLATGNNNITFDVVYEGVSWFGDNNNNVGPGNTKFVSPTQTIATGPTANTGNTLPAICQGGISAALGGSVGGSATGGTWSDGGIGGSFSNGGNISTTRYTPPPAFTGSITLTLSTTGGSCGSTSASKTLTINETPQAITSPVDDICQSGSTASLNGAISGSATGGSWSSSAGGSFSPNAGNLNAKWTPPASFTGMATLTLTSTGNGACPAGVSTTTVNVTPAAIVNAGPALSAICQGSESVSLGASLGGSAQSAVWSDGGIGGSFSNPTNLNATWTSPSGFSGNATLTLTADAGICGSPSASKIQVVNSAPGNISVTPAASTLCFGSSQVLTGSSASSGISSLLIDDFNGTSGFFVSGSASGDRSRTWTQTANGTNYGSVATFTSPNGGSSMVATVGSSSIFGSASVNTVLTSGLISTSDFSSLSALTFNHTYKEGNSGSGKVEISINNGATWSAMATYTSNQGGSGNYKGESLSLSSYVGANGIMLRFNFSSSIQNFFGNNTAWWAVDDVVLNGVKLPLYAWTANTPSSINGLPAGAGTASSSNGVISVNPKATTTYTLIATNASTSCSGSSMPVVITVNPAPTLNAIADVGITTSTDGAGDCNALYSWTHPSANTACATTMNVAYTAGAQAPAALPAGGVVTSGETASVSFSTGVTIVTYTVADANNNTATTSFKVTVTDDELPVITCPQEVIVTNATGECGATVVLTVPVTTDNCGVASVTNDHPSDVFNVGTTIVTWTVKDVNNNIQTCTQKVTVEDTELPTLVCNDDVTVSNDPGTCGATVTLTAPATADNCGVASVTNDHSSSKVFPVGTTIVVWTVTDNSGNVATCEQSVTVTDTEKPVITCPASFAVVTDDDVAYATLTLEQPVVNDNCGILSVVNDHPLNQYPIGTNLVTWTVTDMHNNVSTCVQTIVVNDIIEPAISFNAPLTFNNTPGLCLGSIDVTYPVATDNSGHVTVSSNYTHLSVSSVDPITPLTVQNVPFPVGATTIVWTATDPSNNSNSSTQTVTVVDNEKPLIECPQDIVQVNDAGNCSAVINLATPVTSDNCGVAGVVNDHPSNLFTIGETIVTWTVTDIHGNTNTCRQTVTVTDTELPSITSPVPVTVTNDAGKCSAAITLTSPVVSDNCGIASVTNDHESGVFNVGSTVITWTVADVHGNTNSTTQTVIVNDTEIPVVTPAPDVNAANDAGKCGASVNVTAASAIDNCSVDAITGVRNDGKDLADLFPVGNTIITWTGTDIHGNFSSAVQHITITDTELPEITTQANISVNNDPGLCSASLTIIAAEATDNCGVGSPTGMRLDGAALTDPYPAGITTIEWTVTDIHGNTAISKTQTITVTDNELPVITPDADIIQTTDAGICGATITIGQAITRDNCGVGAANASRSDHLSLTALYPVGMTTITWTVTDIHGNEAVAKTQTVTVTDNELPVIAVAADRAVNNDLGQCGATILIEVPAAGDNCGVGAVAGTRSDLLALTDAYPVGVTTITWTVTDVHGNNAIPVIQTITVSDNEVPVIIANAELNQNNDAGVCGATVTIVPPVVTDNCDAGAATGSRSDGQSLNDLYPVGTTVITWIAKDIHGNNAVPITQEVNVNDQELPVITPAADVTVNNDPGQCGANVVIQPAATADNCGAGAATGTRSDNESLTNVYPVGITTITWTVTDIHGNAAIAATQTITVQDTEKPEINTGDDISQSADAGECGALVEITSATANDNCGVGEPTGTRSDGAALTDSYPVGITTITWTVTDIHGNAAEEVIQTITVTDNEKPVITNMPAAIAVNNDAGICGAKVNWQTPASADNCAVASFISDHSSGDLFPVGTTVVTYTATDIHGNVQTSSFSITVADNEKPTIVCVPDIILNACTLSATWTIPQTGDNCGVASVDRTAGPASGSTFSNGTSTVITYVVKDAAGNQSSCSFTVTRRDSISIAGTNSNPVLYYGSPGDQTSTIKVIPTGGKAPYSVSISMSRKLNCDVVTAVGDETWTANGGTNTATTCGTNTQNASTTWTGVTAGQAVSVKVGLISTGVFIATVTDADGCVKTYTTTVYAEDVRCFAGNSGKAKVKICHKTNKGCVEICVDENAVEAHLAHGDFLGNCTTGCTPPLPVTLAKGVNTNTSRGSADSTNIMAAGPVTTEAGKLSVRVMPNPTSFFFTLEMSSASAENIKVRISDVTGRVMDQMTNVPANSSLQVGERYRQGVYIAEIIQGQEKITIKLIKGAN